MPVSKYSAPLYLPPFVSFAAYEIFSALCFLDSVNLWTLLMCLCSCAQSIIGYWTLFFFFFFLDIMHCNVKSLRGGGEKIGFIAEVLHQRLFLLLCCVQVMVAEALDITRETYFAILMDRSCNGPVMVGSPQGGMDIEEVAASSPELIFKVDNLRVLYPLPQWQMEFYLNLNENENNFMIISSCNTIGDAHVIYCIVFMYCVYCKGEQGESSQWAKWATPFIYVGCIPLNKSSNMTTNLKK